MIQLYFVPKNISQSWQTCSQYSHQTKPFKENPILKVSSPQNTRIVFHCLICVHSKYGNLNPNNKVTGEFFMSDIFCPTNFWGAKFYISKEMSFVWDWGNFLLNNVKWWNENLLTTNSTKSQHLKGKREENTWYLDLNSVWYWEALCQKHFWLRPGKYLFLLFRIYSYRI